MSLGHSPASPPEVFTYMWVLFGESLPSDFLQQMFKYREFYSKRSVMIIYCLLKMLESEISRVVHVDNSAQDRTLTLIFLFTLEFKCFLK